MTDDEKPDFETLRAKRNEAVQAVIEGVAKKHGWDPAKVRTTFDPNACYCNCPEGPCEHDWQGWREFEDGNGGEQVCTRCRMGAMHHSLMTAEE